MGDPLKRLTAGEGERGSSPVTYIFAAVVFIMVLYLGAIGIKISISGNTMQNAASAAARDATLARSDVTARLNAIEAAKRVLQQQGVECSGGVEVSVDTSGFNAPPGQLGKVSVTVNCTVALDKGNLPVAPTSIALKASSTSPVDPYRERS